jgi:hypothetical protein
MPPRRKRRRQIGPFRLRESRHQHWLVLVQERLNDPFQRDDVLRFAEHDLGKAAPPAAIQIEPHLAQVGRFSIARVHRVHPIAALPVWPRRKTIIDS